MSTKRGQKSGLSGGASNNGRPITTSTANAWARPLQSKTAPPPGMGPVDRTSAAAAAAKPASNPNGASPAMINRERLLHLSLTLVGQKVTVFQTNGSVLEGIFHTFTPFPGLPPETKNRYVFNTVKVVKPPASGTNTIKDGSTVIIPADKVVYVQAKNVSLGRPTANGGSSFTSLNKPKNDVMTDSQISGSRGGRDRDLVAAGTAWTTGGMNSRAEALAPSSDSKAGGLRGKGLQGSIGEWDQFKANEELFNVNATYDENLYTTALDKSQLDSRKIAEAERIAREIENTTSGNIHIAEERGHVVETDYDEEDRYSGVLTKDGKVRHVEVSKKVETKKSVPDSKIETAKPVATAAPFKMNYAAAAAKADAGKRSTPPGFSGKVLSATTPSSPEPKPPEKAVKVTPDEKKDTPSATPKNVEKTTDEELADKPESTKENDSKKEKDAKTAAAATTTTTTVAPTPVPAPTTPTAPAEATTAAATTTTTEVPPSATTPAAPTTAPAPAATTPPKAPEEKPLEPQKPAPEVEKPKEEIEEKTDVSKTSSDSAEPKADKEKKSDAKEVAKTSKLNANAKAFSFNPNAKSFTPSFSAGSASESQPPQQQPQQMAEMHAPMQMHAGAHPMQQPHYMHGPMGQPGMMHMMNPQFPGMRYPQYGMDQSMGHMQSPQPPQAHVAVNPQSQNMAQVPNPSGPAEEESAQPQEGEGSQPPNHQQPQPGAPPQMQVQYGPPPGAYFAGQNMGMHPRGPGFSPQFIGAPQQMPVGPGAGSYRHAYPMQPGAMPPNMHMRGPGAPPYYPGPNGPMPYPPGPYGGHGMVDDSDGGFRGRGRGGGRGRGRRGGRGRGGPGRGQSYQSYGGPSNGRQTPQHQHGDMGGAPEGAVAKDGNLKTGDSGPNSAGN